MDRVPPIGRLTRRQCLYGLGAMLVASAASTTGVAYAMDAGENQLIERLISSVENLQQGKFIRNGMSYDADKAASHLRDKLAYFKNDIHTADDFIRLCATRSEMTGIHYKVKDASGVSQDAAEWMYTRLARMRSEQGQSQPTAAAQATPVSSPAANK